MNQKEIRNYLITRAKLGTTINYGSLNQLLDRPYDLTNSYERHLLGEDLGEISEFEHSQGRPLLSAIVVAEENKLSGIGFFEMAERLELFDPSKISKKKFLEQEQKKVIDYWKNH
jgi:hypothetical protein